MIIQAAQKGSYSGTSMEGRSYPGILLRCLICCLLACWKKYLKKKSVLEVLESTCSAGICRNKTPTQLAILIKIWSYSGISDLLNIFSLIEKSDFLQNFLMDIFELCGVGYPQKQSVCQFLNINLFGKFQLLMFLQQTCLSRTNFNCDPINYRL